MHRRNLALAILTTFLAPAALAGESVDRSLAAPLDAVISISNTRGDVTVTGWDQANVAIKGELDDLAEELVFVVEDKNVTIDVIMPRQNVNRGNGSDLDIKVPQGSRVRFSGVSTDIRVENISGGMKIESVSGDIKARQIMPQLMLNAVSGNIEVEQVGGRLSASTISGDLQVKANATDVKVDTVSGDLTVMLEAFDSLAARTISGEMDISGELNSAGEVDLSTVSGDVRLALQSGLNARIDINGGIGSDIDNDYNDAQAERSFLSQQRLKTVIGDGSAHVAVRAVSADITIKQR
jgi:DUF4097 and DUF4098 domain-containing protein YvlB